MFEYSFTYFGEMKDPLWFSLAMCVVCQGLGKGVFSGR